jgi:pimeloyl-ACP methyl ester carboxylesterase
MTQQPVGYEDFGMALESGRLRVRRWGAVDAPAVVRVPGLSANLCGFDRLAERLAGDTLQLVAVDLRGRGRSEVTGAGTYGWRHHARDVLGVADAIGAPSFAVIGQSSGAAIAMTCAQLEPSRVERLVLVDLVLRSEPPGDPQRACGGPGRRCLPACRRAWRRSHRRRAPPPPNGPDRPRSLAPSPRSLVQARCQLAEMLPAPGRHDQVPVPLQN